MTGLRPPAATRRRCAIRLLIGGGTAAAMLHLVLTASNLPDAAPLAPTSDTVAWWRSTSLEAAIGGTARVLVTAVLAYLVLVAVTQLGAMTAPGARLTRLVDRLAPRALALATAGVVIASGTAPGAAAATPSGADRDAITMELLTPRVAPPGSPATERPRPSATVPPAVPPTVQPAVPPEPRPLAAGTLPGTHIVRSGDHLWGIAEQVVSTEGADARTSTVARYWRTLIDTNRNRLVDPDDPDLILPGQELELPPLSPGGGR